LSLEEKDKACEEALKQMWTEMNMWRWEKEEWRRGERLVNKQGRNTELAFSAIWNTELNFCPSLLKSYRAKKKKELWVCVL
jgi:hypothetical protein